MNLRQFPPQRAMSSPPRSPRLSRLIINSQYETDFRRCAWWSCWERQNRLRDAVYRNSNSLHTQLLFVLYKKKKRKKKKSLVDLWLGGHSTKHVLGISSFLYTSPKPNGLAHLDLQIWLSIGRILWLSPHEHSQQNNWFINILRCSERLLEGP